MISVSLLTDTVDIDADRWAEKAAKGLIKEDDETSMTMDGTLPKYYRQARLGLFETPMVVCDKHGRILLWYLPDILNEDHIVSPLSGNSMYRQLDPLFAAGVQHGYTVHQSHAGEKCEVSDDTKQWLR